MVLNVLGEDSLWQDLFGFLGVGVCYRLLHLLMRLSNLFTEEFGLFFAWRIYFIPCACSRQIPRGVLGGQRPDALALLGQGLNWLRLREIATAVDHLRAFVIFARVELSY